MKVKFEGMVNAGARLLGALLAICGVLLVDDGRTAAILLVVYFTFWLALYRFDLTNLWVVFAIPWLMILGFAALDISSYSRPVSKMTLLVVSSTLGIGLLLLPVKQVSRKVARAFSGKVSDRIFTLIFMVYIAFCVLNVALAGYIPLFQGVATGDTGYMDFGVKGLYGLFNAFANAFGLTAFYLWMVNPGKRIYPTAFFTVLGVFLLFVTRQNIISLLAEAFITYCMVVRRISTSKVLMLTMVVLFGFAAIGDARVGANADIVTLAGIDQKYLWLPRAFFWLYAYCYFNLLNLDNVVTSDVSGVFDGSAFQSLLPSFLRPESADSGDFLEVSSFTVSSFAAPIVHDVGVPGLILLFSLLCLAAHWYVRLIARGSLFIGRTGYAVIFFCFAFSFFDNFWFYLPIIFQLFFFPILQWLLIKRGVSDDR